MEQKKGAITGLNRRQFLRNSATVLGAAAGVFWLAGCSSSPTSQSGATEKPVTGGPRKGGRLRLGGGPEPDSLDPQNSSSVVMGNIANMYGDTLLARDPNTGEYMAGGLAESYSSSADGLTWTFKLKKGVQFHDGTPFTSQSLRASYEQALKKSVVTKIYLPPDVTFETPDAETFIMKSPRVYGPMLDHLSWPAWFSVTAEHHRAKVGQDDYGRQPMGTGPFKFKEWVAGDHITLVRNDAYNWGPTYWKNKGAPYVDEVFFKFINEEATLASALEAGEIDAAHLPNRFAAKFLNNPKFKVHVRQSGYMFALAMNQSKAPFNDLRVRRALLHIPDRERILQVLDAGQGRAQYGSLTPALPHFDQGFDDKAKQEAARDLSKAKALLAEAGYQPGADGMLRKDGAPLEMTFLMGGDETQVRLGSTLQAQFKDAGINLKLETQEQAAVNARVSNGNYELTRLGYATLTPDILVFYLHSKLSPDRMRLKDTKLDELLEQGRHSMGDERHKAQVAIQQHILDNVSWIPLYSPNRSTVVSTRVVDFIAYPNAMDWGLNDAWINA